MKIIQVHNYYKQAGGEDTVVKAELELLRANGEEVVTYYKHNDNISGIFSKIATCVKTLWNQHTYKEFRKVIQQEKPDIVHCHNTFPLISPAIYWACSKEGVPVVQTLHNYRLLCLNSSLFRKNEADQSEICELCINSKFKLLGIKYRCYRNSKPGSAVLSAMILLHIALRTWQNKITKYIFLTEFQREKFSRAFQNQNIDIKKKSTVKPNFVSDSDISGGKPTKNYILFVGRLCVEKGCNIALHGFREYLDKSNDKELEFKIIGDGPEKSNLEKLVKQLELEYRVDFTGKVSKRDVLNYMSQAQCLIFSSISYETFGLTIIEAFQQRCPVIAANIGSIHSIIDDNVNGLIYDAHNTADLADKLNSLVTNKTKRKSIVLKAAQHVEGEYTEKTNYKQLIQIYMDAIKKQ